MENQLIYDYLKYKIKINDFKIIKISNSNLENRITVCQYLSYELESCQSFSVIIYLMKHRVPSFESCFESFTVVAV